MDNIKLLGPLGFAMIAAVGNAMFAAGQKKAVGLDNPFTFISVAVTICIFLVLLAAPLFGTTNYAMVIKQNGIWAVLSGVGLFFTYLGFNLLYSNYGASSYVLYAVLSIITTAIFVGVFLFKEQLNGFHWAAVFFSVVTVILFSIGHKVAKG